MERLLDYFVPEKYLLDLQIDKYTKTIEGRVTITGEAKTDDIKFHAVDLSIDEVIVDGKKVKFEVKDGVLTLFSVPRSDLTIEIGYHGTLNENMQGAYLSTYEYRGKTEVIVATQFESHYAREAFPCIDEPAAKAVFELIITTDAEDKVLSNMPEAKNVSGSESLRLSSQGSAPMSRQQLPKYPDPTSASGCKTTIFEPTPRMSTYLLAWVIGRFHGKTVTNAHGIEITTYCALNQDVDSVDFANEIAAKSLEFYDDNFGVLYPLKKLTQVALPDFEAGAMENWGLVTYRESMLLVGKSATLSTKKSVALTVAHELSHQWFGNLVTMKWWDDLWLNESFASVMEYYAVDYVYPEYKIFEGFFTGDCCAALLRDAYSDVQSVHQEVHDPAEIATLFDGAIVYSKGARLMLMLVRLMGWNEFCKGIRDYFEKYKYQNTVGDDLWVSLKSYADFNPSELMHAFIDQPGYPVITNKGDDFARFSQKRFLLDTNKMPESDWPLPEIREDMSGHYVLNLTSKEFEERINRFAYLGLEEKLRLLIDRDLITRSGMQSAASLIPLAQEFKNEDSAAVWSKVAALIANLRIYIDDESPEEKLLKKYALELIDLKLAEIGIVTNSKDDENVLRLRAILLGLDYFAEDEARLAKLAAMYDDDYIKMDNEIRDDILSAKVYKEPEIVDDYLKKYKTVSDPEVKADYLAAACLVKDEKYIDKMLNLLGNIEIVKPQDQLHLFVYLYRNSKAKRKTFEWLTKNWKQVKKVGGEKTLGDYPMLIGRIARTEWELAKFKEFFGPMKDEPTMARAIKIGEKEIKARLDLIKKNREAVIRKLSK